jgi:AcrR family transcriptional regulator
MTTPRPITRKYAERHSALVASAIRLINRRGVSGMTLADVAAEMGQSPKVIAYYFKKKDDLAAECFLQGLRRLNSFVAAAAGEAAPRDRLAALLAAYFDFKRRAELGEMEELTSPNDIRALNSAPVSAAYADFFRGIRSLLGDDDSLPGGRVRRNANAHLVIAALHWTPVWLPWIYPEDYARAGKRVFDVLSGGIAAPGQAWAPRRLSPLALEAGKVAGGGDEPFLVAATRLINQQGYHGASVEKIAASINLTKGAFYHHIDNKDDLIVACFMRSFDLYRRLIAAAEAVSGNGLQHLQTLTLALLERELSDGSGLLRASALTTLPEPLQTELTGLHYRIGFRLGAIISDGIIDGSIRPVDPVAATQVLMGLINTVDELPYYVQGVTLEQAVEHYVRPYFEGLAPAG